MGHAEGVSKLGSSTKLLLSDPESESDGDEEADTPEKILYMASFDELGEKSVQYDTIIWLSISLLLVLAWGIGILMLLYLPMRRYVLKKEISSRKLYVTPDEIVYKVCIAWSSHAVSLRQYRADTAAFCVNCRCQDLHLYHFGKT